ncbi:type I restriction-modification enzyme R subunit C-terminal domain-containing protein [Desulfoplanes sp. PS50]
MRLFLDTIDPREKTLIFCATQPHAPAVRDLVNQYATSSDPNYCARVTANDGAEGERWLRVFQDNEKTIPTVLTTSQKLSTGVDARNVRHIVLMRPINSMVEFKQIVGRGTRLFEGKEYFTIHDFVKAHEHFNDAEWDGEPVEPEPPGPSVPAHEDLKEFEPRPATERLKKEKIRNRLADGKERIIEHMTATSFWGPDGKPISSAQFIEALYGSLPELFRDEDELRAIWSLPDTRRKLLQGLEEKGFGTGQLRELGRIVNADKSDLYDVLAYIAFALAPVSREERVNTHKDRIYAGYDDRQQEFLSFVLGHYVAQGVGELDQENLPDLLEIKYGSMHDARAVLGSVEIIRNVFVGFQKQLYLPVESRG